MKKLLTFVTFACLAGSLPVQAQYGSQLAVANSPAYEEAAAELRSAPPRQYNFAKALLSDTFRLMAEDAGISFFGLPDGSEGADRLVTFSIHASPFSALETLAASNGISLIFENGIWYIRPANDTELIGRIYQINYNAQELVRKNDQGSSTLGGNSSGSSGSGSGSGASSIGLNLQGAPDYFVTEPSRLLEDIRAILDLGTTGPNAVIAPLASVDTVGQMTLRGMQSPNLVAAQIPGNADAENGDNPAKVIWNSDSNSLYVVATRQQHQWIEGYLAAADRPQPLVAVEVKVLETNKDPTTELGLDWTGTLGGGYGAGLSGVESLDIDPDTGITSFTGTDDGRLNTLIDLDRAGDYKLPLAILSYDEVNVRLRALFEDRKTKAVSYPRMITVDNREVSFRSVINQPVLSSNASTSLGAGATQTNSVEYVPIGTVINILPKRMNDGQVLLNISIVVSAIVGTEVINGNPYPIASSRVYTAPVTVESGYTIAISGLDAATHERTDTGVPFLGKIPIIGYAFKYKNDARHNQHLMMLITPTLMDSRAPGVPKKPTIKDPWKNQPAAEVKPISFQAGPQSTHTMAAATPQPAAVPAPVPTPPAIVEATPAPAPVTATSAIAEAMPEAKPERKRFLGGLFSKRNRQAEETPSVEPVTPESEARVDQVERSFADAASQNEKKGWTPFSGRTEEPAESPSPQVVTRPVPAPKPADSRKALKWDGQKLVGGADAVPSAVAYLEDQFKAAEESGDPQKFSKLQADSERLLRYVDSVREEENVPINGKLSDEWWNLVALKTKARNEARSNAPVLVDNVPPEID